MRTFRSFREVTPRNSLNRSVDDFFNDTYRRMLGEHSVRDNEMTIPSANIREHEQEGYMIEIAAPGFRKEDFDVNVDNSVLTIRGERKVADDESYRYTRREYNYLTFERSFMLPDHVREESIRANYRDGILLVTIPVHSTEETRAPRRIDIS